MAEPKRQTVRSLSNMKTRGEKIACLTAYDASFTVALEEAGIDVLLVGDSLGMVVQGHTTTLPVTLDDVIYHSRHVARASRSALLIADMPFMADATIEMALTAAARLMKDGGVHMVKLEAAAMQAEIVEALARRGIPVCAHLGLQPQSVHKLGGYRVQGRSQEAAESILQEADRLVSAGADILLLECIPSTLAAEVTRQCAVPVIGIGAGPSCDGQILVTYDMLGLSCGRRPRFSRDFLAESESIQAAMKAYVDHVKAGTFPAREHEFE